MDKLNSVIGVKIEERISKKTSAPYSVLIVEFANGYKFESFLNNEQNFIIRGC